MAKKHKKNSYKYLVMILAPLTLLGILYVFLGDNNFAVLNPKGTIAKEQFDLIIISTLLMLIVVIPVFIMTFWFAYKYRAGNKKAKYSPDWDHNSLAEFTWWAVPSAIIVVLSVITFKSTYALDPFKPIESDNKPLTIQVVALDWKWLFIYPEQNIASVNYVQFPNNTPIKLEITADAPMNSFWIPQLGGQIYAMAGMSTELNLEASKIGSFDGSSANLSGEGFAGMRFTAKSTSEIDFYKWVTNAKLTRNKLSQTQYQTLSEPSKNDPVVFYSAVEKDLYHTIMEQFTGPMQDMEDSHHSPLYKTESTRKH